MLNTKLEKRGSMLSGRTFSTLLLCLMGLLLIHGEAMADAYHYRNILVGERASGMGGAYTAVSDDTAGLYYNPAGIVYSTGTNLSGSANAIHASRKEYKDVFGGKGWEREASTFLPNFFGVVQDFGTGKKVGLSYVVPDAIIEDQDQTFRNIPSAIDTTGDGVLDTVTNINRYVINFNNDDQTYNFGPSYAKELSDSVSMGATLYLHHRRNQWILNQYITYDTADYEWVNTYYETREWGIKPVLGLMWTPSGGKTSYGLTFSTIEIFDSETRVETTQKPTYTSDTIHVVIEDTGKREYPWNANFGMAYFPSPSTLYALDISYHSKADDDFYGEREAVWNAALGGEFYLNSTVAMRAGLFTNLSSAPDIDGNKSGQVEQVDLYGGSLSISYFTRGASLTLGTSYSKGTGEAQVVEDSTDVQDMEMETWSIFLSSSYNY